MFKILTTFVGIHIFSYNSSSIPRLVTHSLTGLKLGQSYTTKVRPNIETCGLHKDMKDINDNDNNDNDDNNNNKDDNDNNKDDNDNKGNSSLELDRSKGFSRGYDKLSAIGQTSVSRPSQKSGHLLVHPRILGKVAY